MQQKVKKERTKKYKKRDVYDSHSTEKREPNSDSNETS